MAEKKRGRNPNFSLNEKRAPLQCAFEERAIIKNKKIDGTTWKEKESAWDRITANFNSHSGSACYRSVEALKKFYQGYKKDIRKVAADEKMSVLQTGGGNPQNMKVPNFDLAISIMNPKTIDGFENIPDGDGADELFDDQPCDSKKNTGEKHDEILPDWGKYKPCQLKQPVHSKLKVYHGSASGKQEDSIVENADADTERLKKDCINSNMETEKASKWCGRRRPVASTLASSKITEHYSQLSTIKIELAQLQYDTQKEEAIQRKYSNSIEHELRKRSLELDIEIKTELLKKIKTDSITTVEACSVLKDF